MTLLTRMFQQNRIKEIYIITRIWLIAIISTSALFFPGSNTLNAQSNDITRITQEIKKLQRQVAALTRSQAETKEAQETDLRVYWDKGLKFKTADKKFSLGIGGRIQQDWAFIDEDDGIKKSAIGPQHDGAEFRRVRIAIKGTLYDNFFFKMQYELDGSKNKFKDMYMGLKKVGPWESTVKVGHFKEPFSLENLTSSNDITFMERSLPNLFAPGRNTGIAIYSDAFDKRMTFAAGFFRDTDNGGDSFNDSYGFSIRLTGLPLYIDKNKFVHTGLSYSHREFGGEVLDYASDPEVHIASDFIDTGKFSADSADLVSVEAALVYGPLSLQGEYMMSRVDSTVGGSPDFDAFYVYGSYFLTGESRKYKKSSGAFDKVSPKRNFFDGSGGFGAWEATLRYSRANLNDQAITGGRLSNVTAGLNWYLNPNARVMLNYINSDLTSVGNANTVTTRFQFRF